MSMAVAKDVRDNIRKKIWDKADELGWPGLSDIDRATWYENWSKDKDIGGVLAHFMTPERCGFTSRTPCSNHICVLAWKMVRRIFYWQRDSTTTGRRLRAPTKSLTDVY